VIPGRRHDAADQTSAGRHLTLTIPDTGGTADAVIRAGSGAGLRAGHGRGGEHAAAAAPSDLAGLGRRGRRGGIPGPGPCPGEARGSTVPGRVSGHRRPGVAAAALYYVHGTMPRGRAWNGSWNGALDNPSTTSAISAITRAISAASALSVWRRTYGKEKVYGSIP
jgi:hypothetical protein